MLRYSHTTYMKALTETVAAARAHRESAEAAAQEAASVHGPQAGATVSGGSRPGGDDAKPEGA